MANDAQNSPFIKHLASSDKSTRDQALDSLRAYLNGRSQIDEIDLLKLWKGLYYCLWMQDKPALQQRLARDLAGLVGVLKPDVVLPFLESFWKTIARVWGGIDALRMDKYLYLIRQYLNASFKYLARNSWSNTDAVSAYMTMLSHVPLHPTDSKIPNGLRYHVLDIYADELEKVCGDKMDDVPVEVILEPVERLTKHGKDKSVRKTAKQVLDDDRVRRWRGEEVEEELAESGENDEWGGIEG
ncbi:nucleolar protein NOP52 variant [Lophiotrema nucula]|uniref:Nucleolar protein NOP52 variant n=1 Tax=Lophiotrema nucula TaxID=690887 RepID=A0A6A5ZQX6_9PLEO|nr:nucleolar protein NOP52 variant [Lophiotrema nucula]